MTELELTFNPYKKESTLAVNGKVQPKVKARICGADGGELSFWAADFFRRAVDEFNDSVEVTFNGIQRDYEFLEDALNLFEERGSVIKPGRIVQPENVMGQLKSLFAKMRKESPFEALKADNLKRLFDKATDSDFEMAVVATMSAGKSTLINSMIGRELLPAINAATTATIARIHDVDGMDGFNATAYDASGKAIEKCDPLTLEDMSRLNAAQGTSIIEIYGDIPGVESKEVKLVLTDTPGPNNSRTLEHQTHTFRLLDAEWKPMIIYVLNATSLEVNDDDDLLQEVSKRMSLGDRQSHDRFLFVLNKADRFDPDKEPIAKKLDDVREYLRDHGISNPRVMPASARLAKIIRQSRNASSTMTPKEKHDMGADVDWFVDESRMHFSDYACFLSPATGLSLKTLIEEAQSKGDKETLALMYSGVPAIEMAISEYLSKYAIPAKVAAGVATFHSKVAGLKLEADAKAAIAGDKSKLQELQRVLRKLENILNNGVMAKKVKSKIKRLNVENEIKSALSSAGSKLLLVIGEKANTMRKTISGSEARQFLGALKKSINLMKADFIAAAEKAINVTLRAQAQKCIDDYKEYIEALLGKVSAELPTELVFGPEFEISIDGTMDKFVEHKRVKTGEKWVRKG